MIPVVKDSITLHNHLEIQEKYYSYCQEKDQRKTYVHLYMYTGHQLKSLAILKQLTGFFITSFVGNYVCMTYTQAIINLKLSS